MSLTALRRHRRTRIVIVIIRLVVFVGLVWTLDDLLYRGYTITAATAAVAAIATTAAAASRILLAAPTHSGAIHS